MTGNSANLPGNNLASYGLGSPLAADAPTVPEPSTGFLLVGTVLGWFVYGYRGFRRKMTE